MTFDAIVLGCGLGVLLFGWIKRQRGVMFLGGAFAALSGALGGQDLWLVSTHPADLLLAFVMLALFGYVALLLLGAAISPDE